MNLMSSGNYTSGTNWPTDLDTVQSSWICLYCSCTSLSFQAMVAEYKGCVWLFLICFQTFSSPVILNKILVVPVFL